MSIAAKIAPHLPYLRRFGRLFAGSQKSGDACVLAVLESLLADPSSFPPNENSRVALYRCFLRIWGSDGANNAATEARSEPDMGARTIGAITPLPRQAFLLTAVEGFTLKEAAAILDLPPDRVSELLERAGREIAQQVATTVLIIEDEPLIAMDLEHVVNSLGHTVCGIARTRREALEAVRHQRPGLVLADIQLADGSSGLDAVNQMLEQFDVPVVFITAFPQRLLTGERPEPTFLITKPFDNNAVRAVISQALFFDLKAHATAGKRNSS